MFYTVIQLVSLNLLKKLNNIKQNYSLDRSPCVRDEIRQLLTVPAVGMLPIARSLCLAVLGVAIFTRITAASLHLFLTPCIVDSGTTARRLQARSSSNHQSPVS